MDYTGIILISFVIGIALIISKKNSEKANRSCNELIACITAVNREMDKIISGQTNSDEPLNLFYIKGDFIRDKIKKSNIKKLKRAIHYYRLISEINKFNENSNLIEKNFKGHNEQINNTVTDNSLYDELYFNIKLLNTDVENMFSDEEFFISQSTLQSLLDRYGILKYSIEIFLIRDVHINYLKKGNKYESIIDEIKRLDRNFNDPVNAVNIHNKQAEKIIAKKVYGIIGDVEGRALDSRQLMCIYKKSHNHLVIAGAGSGKTTTVVGKVKYLIKTEAYKPEEILLLSFTNASANEMEERIKREIGVSLDVMTFHKLGMNIISKARGIKPLISGIDLRKLIGSHMFELCNSEVYLRRLLAYHINSSKIKNENEFQSQSEYEAYLQSNPPLTYKGEQVKSNGELLIANFLYENGIEYEYEAPYKIDTRTEKFGQYHPDFYLPESDIYIEHFGIDKNGKPPAYFRNDYIESMEWKRALHKSNNTIMIECYSYECLDESLIPNLRDKLKEYDVCFKPLSAFQIWNEVERNHYGYRESLSRLFETIINLMKSNRFDMAYMKKLCAERPTAKAELSLLDAVEPFWNKYNELLKENDEIDFNDMINNAVDEINEKNYINPYKMVIVDEYQDISKARFNLLSALRASNDYELFCVGDDWQSIYRFAGSDISYIQEFSKYWGYSDVSYIENTYRFNQKLVNISGNFIMKNPMQIKKNLRGFLSEEYVLGVIKGYNDKCAVSFLTDKLNELPQNSSVFFIGRYTFDIKMLKTDDRFSIRYNNRDRMVDVKYNKRQDLKMRFITAHRSKGLQADYVFIINNFKGKMGFPSEIQDSSIMDILLHNYDTYPFAEERRLFYVAMTRAVKKVFLVAVQGRESLFLKELEADYADEIKREGFSCPICGGRLIKRNGKYGEFFGCENYYTTGCRFTRNINKAENKEIKQG